MLLPFELAVYCHVRSSKTAIAGEGSDVRFKFLHAVGLSSAESPGRPGHFGSD
jgi:hypothetical protein